MSRRVKLYHFEQVSPSGEDHSFFILGNGKRERGVKRIKGLILYANENITNAYGFKTGEYRDFNLNLLRLIKGSITFKNLKKMNPSMIIRKAHITGKSSVDSDYLIISNMTNRYLITDTDISDISGILSEKYIRKYEILDSLTFKNKENEII
ncbi:MAG: hypothetical protein SLAVMIC_00833 [uncultured marine phage]|uniref:Uncharacterized protein n=1 Tax=uncultured marine phage TaxID=707152 RepID=A0A8D9C9L4_9VIRU|nr:MAG: hypothetical protein SLAVMIC_00833 [uncultured marine phage]